eukprot:77047-Pyramimonas_sp.AAC.1
MGGGFLKGWGRTTRSCECSSWWVRSVLAGGETLNWAWIRSQRLPRQGVGAQVWGNYTRSGH